MKIDEETVAGAMIFGALVLFIVLVLAFVIWVETSTSYRAHQQPCSEMGYITQKNLPARCVAYWKER